MNRVDMRLSIASQITSASEVEIFGGKHLNGTVFVHGQKHSMVLGFAAALALGIQLRLGEVPEVTEREVLSKLMKTLGIETQCSGRELLIDAREAIYRPLDECLTKQVHGSVYLVPAMVARFGQVEFYGAGGDQLGNFGKDGGRPLFHILEVMQRFGCEWTRGSYGELLVTCTTKLRAADFDVLDWSSDPQVLNGPLVSGATKTGLLMAAVCSGMSRIRNPHDKEAEKDLGGILAAAGVDISFKENEWFIDGYGRDKTQTTAFYELTPDIPEAVSWIVCAVTTNSTLEIACSSLEKLQRFFRSELAVLSRMGISLLWSSTGFTVEPLRKKIRATNIIAESSGLATDLAPLLSLLLLTGDGPATLQDRVWSKRYGYITQLRQMGATIYEREPGILVLPSSLHSPQEALEPQDTRSAAVSVFAALGVPGKTSIRNVHHLTRGYDGIFQKLYDIGAHVVIRR